MPDKNKKKTDSDDELSGDVADVAVDTGEVEEVEESEWEGGGGDTDEEEDF